MKIKTLAFTSLALLALLALPAAAQTDYRTDRQYDWQTDRGSYRSASDLVPCDMLLGEDVHTMDGDEVGDLEAIVLHPQGDRVAYAVVSKGSGFLGFGDKDKFAVPWSALDFERTSPDDFDIILNVSGEQLDNAIEVDDVDDHLGDEQFIRDVYAAFGPQYRQGYDQEFGTYRGGYQGNYRDDQYGRQPDWSDVAMTHRQSGGKFTDKQLKVSKLLGEKVVGGNQDKIGSLEDIACERGSGQLAYAIIDVDGDIMSNLGLSDDEHIAVPWMAVQPRQDHLAVRVSEQDFPQLTLNYDDNDIEDLNDPGFAMQIDQIVGVQPTWTAGQMGGQMSMRTGRPYQDRFSYDNPNYRRQPSGRETWRDQPMSRNTWNQDEQNQRMSRDTWNQDEQDQPQLGRNTWDLDNRRSSYRGQTTGRMQRGMNQGMAQGQSVTVNGTVRHVFTHTAGGMDELVLQLQTNDGETVFVQAGPDWFAQQKNVDFQPGDRISVTGNLVSNPGQTDTVVARKIDTRNQTLTLRDRQLRPEWARR